MIPGGFHRLTMPHLGIGGNGKKSPEYVVIIMDRRPWEEVGNDQN